MNNPHFSGFKFLLAGVLFFFMMFFIYHLEKYKNEPAKLAEKFQIELNKKQRCAEEILYQKNKKIEQGLSVFLFNHDSLVFWSDNTIPLPPDIIPQKITRDPVFLKLKNGMYMMQGKHSGTFSMVVVVLIKQEYPFENDYLKNGFPEYFKIPSEIGINFINQGIPVYFSNGRYALSLNFPSENIHKSESPSLLLAIFLAGFLCIIVFLVKAAEKISNPFQWKYFSFFLVAVSVTVIRIFQFCFKFPSFLYNTELFGPAYYSSSFLLPSLGDLLINSTILLVLSCIFFLKSKVVISKSEDSKSRRLTKALLGLFSVIIGFFLIAFFIDDFIINSIIPLNLQNVSKLVPYSIYGIYIIWAIWASFFFFFWKVVSDAISLLKPGLKYFIGLRTGIVTIILFSFITMLIINHSYSKKEKEERRILANQLTTKRNPLTETLFLQVEKIISGDTTVQKISAQAGSADSLAGQTLENYLKTTCFGNYWNKFNIQITVCSDRKSLQIQPQGYLINCQNYFQNIIKEFGEKTISRKLFFLDYGYGKENYLAIFRIGSLGKNKPPDSLNIYIEISSKYAFKDLGYPELLIDHRLVKIPDIAEYSYAIYQNGMIQYSAGKFQYDHSISNFGYDMDNPQFFAFSGFSHYHSKLNESEDLIISRKQENLLTILSPFAYLFIFFALSSFILLFFLRPASFKSLSPETLRDRLQVSIIGILLLSFLALGLVIMVYIIRLNNAKNDDYLRERALSVQMELQYKFSSLENGFQENNSALDNQLIKMSNIFFSDINLFHSTGQIVASSRPQVFAEGLISDRMNPHAYHQLKALELSLVINREHIGRHFYSSAYMPIYTNKGKLLGYVNLPYFSRQDDLKKEISSFMVTFINLYVVLFISGVLIAFLVAKYISSPLGFLALKMSEFKLGKPNEKIDWKRKDEIGQLVEQYNKMVFELGESIEKLATSEREGAWREMARQVAHEIKNPLTPMKLSVQHLQRAWNDQAPGWASRLEHFTQTITDQIDALASIASEFSDFAQMPLPLNEKLDLVEITNAAIFLYQEHTQIITNIHLNKKQAYINGDRKQLLRVFTNLMNNAIEAISGIPDGQIHITLEQSGSFYMISMADNGRGIPTAQKESVFQPNFTTKSGGMGLGLAIVKTILQSMNSTISVESEEGSGATFIISLPIFNDNVI